MIAQDYFLPLVSLTFVKMGLYITSTQNQHNTHPEEQATEYEMHMKLRT